MSGFHDLILSGKMAEEGRIVLHHLLRLEYGGIHGLQIGGDFWGMKNIFPHQNCGYKKSPLIAHHSSVWHCLSREYAPYPLELRPEVELKRRYRN